MEPYPEELPHSAGDGPLWAKAAWYSMAAGTVVVMALAMTGRALYDLLYGRQFVGLLELVAVFSLLRWSRELSTKAEVWRFGIDGRLDCYDQDEDDHDEDEYEDW